LVEKNQEKAAGKNDIANVNDAIIISKFVRVYCRF
jgi:hypothetical protein